MNWNIPLSMDDLEDLCIRDMSLPELRALLDQLNVLYDEQQGLEPDEEDSDEYDEWQEGLELIDDLIDDIRDRIDELA